MKLSELIERAKAEIGTTEYPPNSNKVKYNDWYYGREVQGSQYPWCATFVSWLYRDTNIAPKTASCISMLSWFEQKNQVVTNPQPGDIVFFKYSTNNRRTNHVGIVLEVNGNVITTIEGNTSQTSQDNGGSVMRRERNSNIVAYARPKYEDAESPKKSVEEVAKEVIKGLWGNGRVRVMKLEMAGYNCAEVQKKVNELLKG